MQHNSFSNSVAAPSSPIGGASGRVPSLKRLAETLGCSRVTIWRLAKRSGSPKPDGQGRYDVEAWRQFVAACGKPRTLAGMPGDLAEEKLRSARVKNAMAELELEERRGELVPAVEMIATGAALGDAIRQVLLRHLPAVAQDLVGLQAPEIAARLREVANDCLAQFEQLPSKIFPDGRVPAGIADKFNEIIQGEGQQHGSKTNGGTEPAGEGVQPGDSGGYAGPGNDNDNPGAAGAAADGRPDRAGSAGCRPGGAAAGPGGDGLADRGNLDAGPVDPAADPADPAPTPADWLS